MSKFCQSCMMPHDQDPAGGGTEADGSINPKYCSYCYQDGAYTWPDANAREMQAFCVDKMVEQGFWRPMAWLMTRGIPRLERWRA